MIRNSLKCLILSVALLCGFGAGTAEATHFRGVILEWANYPPLGVSGVSFQIRYTVRRSGYNGTDPYDGRIQVGDVVPEDIGVPSLTFGDGSSVSSLYMRVIAIDRYSDVATAYLETASTTTPGFITHAYPGAGPYTAYIYSCCRVSTDPLNSDSDYRFETNVSPGSPNRPPITNAAWNVDVFQGDTVSYQIPAIDPEAVPVSFRLSTTLESALTVFVPGLIIDPATGVVTWPVLATQTPGPYGAQFMVEDGVNKVPVDMTFTVHVPGTNVGPAFDTPPSPCAQIFNAKVGIPVSFDLQATDPNAADKVYLNNNGLPGGAVFSPTTGNPSKATFDWTPTCNDRGDIEILLFTATDTYFNGTPCSVFIRVAPAVTATMSGSKTSCAGAPTTVYAFLVGDPPFDVTWNDGVVQSGITSNAAVRTVNPAVTTTYSLTAVSDSCGAGTATGSTTVNVGGAGVGPSAAVIAGSPNTCVGGSATISASLAGTPPWNVVWSDGVAQTGILSSPVTRSVSPVVTTTYEIVDVQDASCSGVPSGSITVTIYPKPVVTITSVDSCFNSLANVASVPSAGAGATYAWTISGGTLTSNGANTVTFNAGPSPGPVTLGVTVTTSNNCASTASQTIVLAPRGDANSNGKITVSDIFFLVNHLFKDGLPPTPVCRGDANNDTAIQATDIFYLIYYLYSGGPAPTPSGVDPDGNALMDSETLR